MTWQKQLGQYKVHLSSQTELRWRRGAPFSSPTLFKPSDCRISLAAAKAAAGVVKTRETFEAKQRLAAASATKLAERTTQLQWFLLEGDD